MNDMSRGIGNHLRGDHRKERTATCRIACSSLTARVSMPDDLYPAVPEKLLDFCAYEDECSFTQCTHIFHYG
jgi:hypothetical protein